MIKKLKKLFSHGLAFSAGFVAGHHVTDPEKKLESDIYYGRRLEMRLNHPDARDQIAQITGWLNYDWSKIDDVQKDKPYGVAGGNRHPLQDSILRNLRSKFIQGIKQAGPDEDVVITINDRERLMIFDLTFSGPSITEMRDIGREEYDVESLLP